MDGVSAADRELECSDLPPRVAVLLDTIAEDMNVIAGDIDVRVRDSRAVKVFVKREFTREELRQFEKSR